MILQINNANHEYADQPRWISQPKPLVSVKEGSSFSVDCRADGEPRPTITVLKREGRTIVGTVLPVSTHDFHSTETGWVRVNTENDLSLSMITKSHASHYKCRADNGLEPAIESDFQLLVSGMILSLQLVLPATGSPL